MLQFYNKLSVNEEEWVAGHMVKDYNFLSFYDLKLLRDGISI